MVEELWINTASGRLYAKRWRGDGAQAAPIVLFHDSLGAVDLWRDFPENLARATGRDVVAYDRLGFGRSDPNPARLALDFIETEATDGFAALREQLGLARFVVFGHSVGGGMASNVAATYPQQCVAMVTESAQAFVEDRTLNGIAAADISFAEPGQLERLARYHGDKAEWVLRAWVDTWHDPAFLDWSLTKVLPRVQCPVLAIHGDDDEYGSLDHPRRFEKLAPQAVPAAILDGCGHVPHREKPQVVLDVVEAFLRGK